MGNYRSGRGSFGAKPTVEASCSLDILLWMREGLTRVDTVHSGVRQWSELRTGKVISSIEYSIDMNDPHVRLKYTVTRTKEPRDYRVKLVSTSPNYGGLRWWFLCPATSGGRVCQRRVRKLYPSNGAGIFACRQCCWLSYTSQGEDTMNRALSKAQAIRRRLGGSGSTLEAFPAKPKRMWWRTYRRLRTRSEEMYVLCLRSALGRLPK